VNLIVKFQKNIRHEIWMINSVLIFSRLFSYQVSGGGEENSFFDDSDL